MSACKKGFFKNKKGNFSFKFSLYEYINQIFNWKQLTIGIWAVYNIGTGCKNDIIKGLGYWTEQALESVHKDFNEFWKLRKIGAEHETHQAALLKAVVTYNKRHMWILEFVTNIMCICCLIMLYIYVYISFNVNT